MFVNLPVIYVLDNTGLTAKLRNDHKFFRGILRGDCRSRSCRCEPVVGKGKALPVYTDSYKAR